MGELETDYLVVGAGAAGMAFADSLITASDADVVLVSPAMKKALTRLFGNVTPAVANLERLLARTSETSSVLSG